MKVILLIPHLAGGGGERVLSDLARGLETEVVLVTFEESFTYPFEGRVLSLGLPIDRRSVFRRAVGFLRRALRLRKALRVEGPAVVVSFMGEANILNLCVSTRPIVTVHSHMSTLARARPWTERVVANWLVRHLYRRARIVAVSDAVREDLEIAYKLPGDRIVVIPNPVDVAGLRVLASEQVEYPWDRRLPVVISVGRLALEKGQWHLLRAFSQITRDIPCQLALVGTGDMEGELRKLSQSLGVEDRTFFLGWQPNPFAYIAGSTVFVMSSMTEGFGLALVEAMACGLPVIATDCPGGSKEIVAPGGRIPAGILVSPPGSRVPGVGDPPTAAEEELRAAIVRLIRDPELRATYAARGFQRAQDFRYEAFVARYRELIHEAGSDGS